MSKKKPGVHVMPHRDGGWKVQSGGAQRADSRHPTQAGAIDRGRELAQTRRDELSIHGRDGQIRDKRSYGNDPNPPKDKK